MSGREFDERQREVFLRWLIGYAVALSGMVAITTIVALRAFPPPTLALLVGATTSVCTLGMRHAFRAVSPFPPVEVPPRQWR